MFKILLTSLMTISLYAGDYVVDKAHTNVNFAIKHLTISLVTGVFHELDGTFTYDEKSGTLTALEGVVQTASIDTGVEKRNAHLKTADFFDAEKYPTLKLKMKGVKGGKVFVDLHIKDVTKTVAFDYINGGAVTDPWGKRRGHLVCAARSTDLTSISTTTAGLMGARPVSARSYRSRSMSRDISSSPTY